MLITALLEIMADWSTLFKQKRTHARAVRQSVGSLCSLGRRTISRAICCLGDDQQDWSAEYRLHSRSEWEQSQLFKPILKRGLRHCRKDYIAVAFDDTRLKKTGRKIPGASWWRDPLSPPFHVNLMFGCRYLQASLLIPHYETDLIGARAVPISFTEVTAVKSPGRSATPEDIAAYKEAVKIHSLSTVFIDKLVETREMLDDVGGKDKTLIVSLDGSFCNRNCLSGADARTVLVARARRDARLCFADTSSSARVYDVKKFTPEAVRQDETIPWQRVDIFHGGASRSVRYKEVSSVLWQQGTKRKVLRLYVLAPTPYRTTRNGKLLYRAPAYLLCTGAEVSTDIVIQTYFDRWQIEVNHRDEKDTLGVGQAQVWSKKSVPRQPAMVVATYAALLMASIDVFGPTRTNDYRPLPKWRRSPKRASLQDMIAVIRQETTRTRPDLSALRLDICQQQMIIQAAA